MPQHGVGIRAPFEPEAFNLDPRLLGFNGRSQ